MPHKKTVTIAWFEQPGYYKLETPIGTIEGESEQECYDAFVAYVAQDPHTLVNALMPENAKPIRGSGR